MLSVIRCRVRWKGIHFFNIKKIVIMKWYTYLWMRSASSKNDLLLFSLLNFYFLYVILLCFALANHYIKYYQFQIIDLKTKSTNELTVLMKCFTALWRFPLIWINLYVDLCAGHLFTHCYKMFRRKTQSCEVMILNSAS